MKRETFASFYLRKVALNEGCGCAEQIIGTRDIEARAGAAALHRGAGQGVPRGLRARLRRLFGRAKA